MDEDERLAYYESIRQAPSGGVSPHQRRVHAQHRELGRQYVSSIKVQDRKARFFNIEINRQRQLLEERLEQLKQENQRCGLDKERNHYYLETIEERHNSQERTRVEPTVMAELNSDLSDVDVMRAIGKFVMTKSMKRRMQTGSIPANTDPRLSVTLDDVK